MIGAARLRRMSPGHHSSSANPDHGQLEEDSHSAGVAAVLNKAAASGEIKQLVVIAAPRALGELRKHYGKSLSAVLAKEIDKDLTGHSRISRKPSRPHSAPRRSSGPDQDGRRSTYRVDA